MVGPPLSGHRNLKSRIRIKPWKEKRLRGKSVQGMSAPKQYKYKYRIL
jgi:hypothetical protein